jgi:hypothetical protein
MHRRWRAIHELRAAQQHQRLSAFRFGQRSCGTTLRLYRFDRRRWLLAAIEGGPRDVQ